MEQLSFFDKLAVLGSNILAHPIFILLLLSPIIVFALNKKITKKYVIAIYVFVLVVVLFVGNTTLFTLLDNVINGLFMTLYFPNFVTLFIVEVTSAIITLITFIRKNMLKVNKVINIVGFLIIQTIFCLILTVVQVNGIDIYKENSLYANNDILTLMQLLMGTFALQILTVVIFNSIEKITEMLDNNDERVRKYRNLEKAKGLILDEPEDLFSQKEEINIIEEPIKPLDKNLIKEEKITPISLVDAIKEENKNVIKINNIKPEEILNIKDTEQTTPEIFKAPPVIKVTSPKPPVVETETLEIKSKEKPKEVDVSVPVINETLNSVESTNKFINPIVEEIFASQNEKTLEEDLNISPEIMQIPTISEPITTIKQEDEELITGLVIVNLNKTLLAIRNIKRIYTM